MITFRVDNNMLAYIEKSLGSMKKDAKKVLADAVNDTAKDAKKMLANKARESYTVKSGRFQKAMKLKRASRSKPTAIITAKGNPMELIDFKASPAKPSSKADHVKAKNVTANAMKALIKKGGESNGKDLKAFVVKFRSGHTSIASRIPGTSVTKEYTTKSGYSVKTKGEQIKTLPSLAIPQMLKSEQYVYGILKPKINKKLRDNVNKRIRKVLTSKK